MALTEAEIAERVHSIGSSEVSAILGLNEWQSVHQVYLAKLGLADFAGNAATEAGNDFEEVILRRAARHNELELLPSRKVAGPEPWLTATPDAFIKGGGIVEAKMVGYGQIWSWGSEEDGVPYPYLCQVQHQLMCTGEPFCIVAAQMGTRHKYYRILPDVEFQSLVVDRLRAFWFGHVVPRIPPPVDGSDGAREMLKKLYPRSERAMREATPEEEDLARRIMAAHEGLDKAKDAASKLENMMRESVQDWERVVGDGWKIRYKNTKTGSRPFYFEVQKKVGIAA